LFLQGNIVAKQGQTDLDQMVKNHKVADINTSKKQVMTDVNRKSAQMQPND
jgi:hypothetical protein